MSTFVEELRGQPRQPGVEVVLAAITGLSALSGGLTLVVSPSGEAAGLGLALLGGTGFGSFLAPGLLLALVVGGLNLTAVGLTLKKSRWASAACLAAGGALFVFIVCEALLIRVFHPLQPVMAAIGLAIAGLSFPPREVRS